MYVLTNPKLVLGFKPQQMSCVCDLDQHLTSFQAIDGNQPKFSWRDGIFLSALKEGAWVILDEMNLASQSVLEGLNAVLDHRATVYIPELNQEFKCPPSFRVFACQNPTQQGTFQSRSTQPKEFFLGYENVSVRVLDSRTLSLSYGLSHVFQVEEEKDFPNHS